MWPRGIACHGRGITLTASLSPVFFWPTTWLVDQCSKFPAPVRAKKPSMIWAMPRQGGNYMQYIHWMWLSRKYKNIVREGCFVVQHYQNWKGTKQPLEKSDPKVSGGRWWCSTQATGRRTPSMPSSLSRLVPQIFSENQTILLTLLACLWPNWFFPLFDVLWWLFS